MLLLPPIRLSTCVLEESFPLSCVRLAQLHATPALNRVHTQLLVLLMVLMVLMILQLLHTDAGIVLTCLLQVPMCDQRAQEEISVSRNLYMHAYMYVYQPSCNECNAVE